MLAGREYQVTDDGEDIQLALMVGGVQVGGALFPVGSNGSAFALADAMGKAFLDNSDVLAVTGFLH
jgi:hypothetical protein